MSPIDAKPERIIVETDRYRVEGDVTLLQKGYRNALSEFLNNRDEEFIFLENVKLEALDGSGRNWESPVLMLSRRHIRAVMQKAPP